MYINIEIHFHRIDEDITLLIDIILFLVHPAVDSSLIS